MLLYYVCANTMYTLWSQLNDSDSDSIISQIKAEDILIAVAFPVCHLAGFIESMLCYVVHSWYEWV